MPTALKETQTEAPPRKRWTRSEVEILESTGVFNGGRFELVEGELIDRMGKKRPHAVALSLMMLWFQRTFGIRFVQSEIAIDVAPLDNPTSEPEPDIVVLKSDFTSFRANPRRDEIHLVVEVGDSTLTYDLTVKTGLYARAAIREYWVLNVQGRQMIVHREPQGGSYRSVETYGAEESVAPLAAPNALLRVGEVFVD